MFRKCTTGASQKVMETRWSHHEMDPMVDPWPQVRRQALRDGIRRTGWSCQWSRDVPVRIVRIANQNMSDMWSTVILFGSKLTWVEITNVPLLSWNGTVWHFQGWLRERCVCVCHGTKLASRNMDKIMRWVQKHPMQTYPTCRAQMEVSIVMGVAPSHPPFLDGIFHYKPSS